MSDQKDPITPAFAEKLVDRIIYELGKKLDDLDISLDYIAAAILDDSVLGISAAQSYKGRGAKIPQGRRAPGDRLPIAAPKDEG